MAQRKPTHTSSVNPVGIDFGKLPPQALDLEEAVLGAIMLEKDAILQVIDLLKPESFYKDEHQKIYQAIIDLTSGNRAIDLLTVTEELRKKKQIDEVGGPVYITHMLSIMPALLHKSIFSAS
jgi:replicative DNA helicase